MLRVPNYPEEFCKFTGELIHSAQWDPTVDLTGKRVGVVGTGASAIQIVPTIVNRVEKLTVFQRRAPYLMPKIQFEYPEACKWALAKVPGLRWATRATIFWLQELLHIGFQHNTIGAKLVEKISTVQRRSQISQEMLRKKMTPNYEFGCKRILPTNDYYPAIQKPNVEVVSSKIKEVKDRTIWSDDGTRTDLDVLILATGYKAHDYFAPMNIIGKNSEDILHTWKTDSPKTYLGTVCSSLPNYFSLLGPNTALGHNSVIFMIECQVEWMIRLLQEMHRREVNSFNVKESAEDDFMHFFDEGHRKTVWGNASCGSWYVNSKGKITTLWPFNVVSFWRLLLGLNTEDFDFQ
ncbi:unnamed protein product [Orchesella dallaii]|uniref:Flavin-containing monooxygenase n=1 Tax=Orchesella dallaii TaxID=48710 RepID=A0ABP1Q7Z8_9HEXA